MSYLKKLLFLAGLTVFLSSFSFVVAQSSPDLELSVVSKVQRGFTFNPRFTAEVSGRKEDDYFFSQGGGPRISKSRDAVVYSDAFRKSKVIARNTGTKTIKAVAWEVSFYSDAQMTQVLKSYQIYSEKEIAAGQTKKLNWKDKPSAKSRTQYHKIRPLRIEYTDGTIWEAP